MDIEIQTNSTKMEVPHRTTIQHRKEKVLGEIPNVIEEKKQQRVYQDTLQQGDTVYFTAFTKQDPNTVYVCKGEITKVPDGKDIKTFRVKITAVADRAVGGKPTTEQKTLIGRAINKRFRELHKHMGPIMMPKTWLN